ncbi:MAG: VTT domain-containing protein [Pseudomonadota bacterium]
MRADLFVLAKKLLPFLALIGLAMGAVAWLATELDVFEGGFDALLALSTVETHLLVVLLYVMATLTSVIPLSILAASTGAFFGLWHGFLLAAVCLMISAGPPYFLAQRLLRAEVKQVARHFIEIDRLNAAIAEKGTQVAFLLRLSPIAPFGITSYIFGLTDIRPHSHFIAVFAAYPTLFGTVLSGHLAAEAVVQAREVSVLQTGLLILGACGTLAAVVLISRIISKHVGTVVK